MNRDQNIDSDWQWLLNNGFEGSDAYKKLISLKKKSFGKLYYQELMRVAEQKDLSLPDKALALITRMLVEAYEWDTDGSDTITHPKANKDLEIQNYLRRQLISPTGYENFHIALKSIDMLASDYELYDLLEQSLGKGSDYLTQDDKNQLRIKYSASLPDIFTKNIDILAEQDKVAQINSALYVFETINEMPIEIIEQLKGNTNIHKFISNNKTIIKASDFNFNKDNFESEDEFNRWREELSNQSVVYEKTARLYDAWVNASARMTESDSANYYSSLLKSNSNNFEKLIIINNIFEKNSNEYENTEEYTNLVELIKSDPLIKQTLEDLAKSDDFNSQAKAEKILEYHFQ